MKYLIWRIRYTMVIKHGYGLRNGWYSSGCYEDCWQDTDPEAAASDELVYASEG